MPTSAPDLTFWEGLAEEDLFARVAAPEVRDHVLGVMGRLATDPKWTAPIVDLVTSGRLETRCFLSWLAREMQPATYLEVGVRRGFSMAVVASRSPRVEAWGFDLWVENYGDVENPGPDFVQRELAKVGYTLPVHFVSGDSHKTLRRFFGQGLGGRISRAFGPPRPGRFDLITVDGDHSLLGAYQDLADTLPHLEPGGVLVFDDIVTDTERFDPAAVAAERAVDPHGWKDLHGVWKAIQERFPGYRFYEYTANPPGIGLAVRLD